MLEIWYVYGNCEQLHNLNLLYAALNILVLELYYYINRRFQGLIYHEKSIRALISSDGWEDWLYFINETNKNLSN